MRGKTRPARLALRLAAVFTALAVAWLAGEWYASRDWQPWFEAQKGRLVSVEETAFRHVPDGAVRSLRLTDDRGLSVNIEVREPAVDGQPHPALVTLGGAQGGGRVAELAPAAGRLVLVSVDYPYDGPRRGLSTWGFLNRLPAMRRALLKTPAATTLAVDYLSARGDIDPERIALVGGSLGALVAPAAAATEPRFSAVAILFGAGNLKALVGASIDVPWPLRRPVAWLANLVVSPLEPLKYIGRISPRPVLLLNGLGDRRMPEALVRELHAKAGEPKTAVWLDVGHAQVASPAFRELVVAALHEWLEQVGVLAPGDFPP